MIINGKSYRTPEFSFNTMCEMENFGVSFEEMRDKPRSGFRAFVAIAMGTNDLNKAGAEIEQHVVNGGDLQELFVEMTKSMEESDFFQALKKKVEESTTDSL